MSTWTVSGHAQGWTVPGFTGQRELGRGASGRVVEAVHDESGHRVAIKYLSPALTGDPAFMRRFRAEAPALCELDGPHAVHVYDFIEQPGQGAAVILELVAGVSLREMIERQGLRLRLELWAPPGADGDGERRDAYHQRHAHHGES